MDQFAAAFFVFAQEAGARLRDFIGLPLRKAHVPSDVLDDAARTLVRLAEASGQDVDVSDPSQVAEVQREILAQVYEEMWEKIIAPTLTTPAKRAEMLLWLEDQAGRPLSLPS
jgi:FixJ family two-component response regulator